jgi:hypothetical protein
VSTGKKFFVPNFLKFGFFRSRWRNPGFRFAGPDSSLDFRLEIPSAPAGHCFAEAIRSVTHLVLAPAGGPEQFIHLEPKGRTLAASPLRPLL